MSALHQPATRRRTAPPLAVLAVLSLVVALLTTAGAAAASPSEESAFVAGVNNARAAAGLPALTVDTELIGLARGWTSQMKSGVCGEDKYICHANPISAGMTQEWAKLGENVGTGPDVDSVMEAFIASPGHYANIVDPEFTHIGVGVIRDPDNPARLFTTHRFMKLQNAPDPEPEPADAPEETVPDTTAPEPEAEPQTVNDPDQGMEAGAVKSSDPVDDTPEEAPARISSPPPVTLERANVVVRALSRMD